MRKLRILYLHGYHGSATVLSDQMRMPADGLEPLADFVCIDAPALAKGDFGWWHAKNSTRANVPGIARYEGWARTCERIVSAFKIEGPFDGIFGFSQGAALAGLLVGLRSPDGMITERQPLSFDFAVLVGGFLARDPALTRLYEATPSYALPSVHIMGRSDAIVLKDQSRMVSTRFKNPLVLEHRGGHVIPSTPEIRGEVSTFLAARRRQASWRDQLVRIRPR
jgi:predicted esterase